MKEGEKKKLEAAARLYFKDYENPTDEELREMGFDEKPGKEYLRERVLETLAKFAAASIGG